MNRRNSICWMLPYRSVERPEVVKFLWTQMWWTYRLIRVRRVSGTESSYGMVFKTALLQYSKYFEILYDKVNPKHVHAWWSY